MAEKIRALRVFTDADGRINDPLGDREVLCVSQFTLYADTRRGNRPSFVDAADPAARSRSTTASASSSPRRGACSARTWRSSWSTTDRSRCCSSCESG